LGAGVRIQAQIQQQRAAKLAAERASALAAIRAGLLPPTSPNGFFLPTHPPHSPATARTSPRSPSSWDLPSPALSLFAVSPRGPAGSAAARSPDGRGARGGFGGDFGAVAFFGSLADSHGTLESSESDAGGGGQSGGGEGYEAAEDPASGHAYWFNRATGHRTWADPSDA
jgi:hypothetical protein